MSLSLHRIFDLSIRFSRYDAQEIECVRWKLASISTYSIDCIACLHATEKLCFEVHRNSLAFDCFNSHQKLEVILTSDHW